uniref:Uncharacterized protein n=1 Tax=Trichobilharzia regenti TaxID=157069 RepID=A0AA85K0S1_TRIRE|nr:unnamed protein product [Trichobilharzia regenti]
MCALTRLQLQFEEDNVSQYCLDLGFLRKERICSFGGVMTLKSSSRSTDGYVHRCAICLRRLSIRKGKLIILIFRRNFFCRVASLLNANFVYLQQLGLKTAGENHSC